MGRLEKLQRAVLLYLLYTRVLLASYRHIRARGLVRACFISLIPSLDRSFLVETLCLYDPRLALVERFTPRPSA